MKKIKVKNKKNYLFSDVFLDTAKTEYQNQIDRIEKIDNKTNILIAIKTVILGFVLDNYDFKQSFKLLFEQNKNDCIIVWLIAFQVLSFIFIFISFVYSFKTLNLRPYGVVTTDDFNDERFFELDKNKFSYIIATTYIEANNTNKQQNMIKCNYFEQDLKYVFISIVCFTLSFILLNVIK